jgi:hypothetical protein
MTPPEVFMFRKADIILACALIVIGLAASYIFSFGQSDGSLVEITCDGELFGSYSLTEDREITVERNNHTNKVTIKDGTVSMKFSDCSGQDCVQQGNISKSGETIVCLPNKVIVEITGSDREYDTISQ